MPSDIAATLTGSIGMLDWHELFLHTLIVPSQQRIVTERLRAVWFRTFNLKKIAIDMTCFFADHWLDHN